jgi:hypothetical protein
VDVQLLDVEWLLSTLFDASLLSPLSRRQRRLLFLPFTLSAQDLAAECLISLRHFLRALRNRQAAETMSAGVATERWTGKAAAR